MKLIFLYGPPASGKLTIAQKLSEMTGIALFHNHLSRDLVQDIYGDKLKENYELVDRIRFEIFDYCAQNGKDLIFTYVYEGEDDDANVKKFINIIEKYEGNRFLFIEVTADKNELMNRVDNESRQQYKKLTNPEILDKITQDMSVYSIPYIDALKIDTTKISAQQAAEKLKAHLKD